jgi:hypothetical protein
MFETMSIPQYNTPMFHGILQAVSNLQHLAIQIERGWLPYSGSTKFMQQSGALYRWWRRSSSYRVGKAVSPSGIPRGGLFFCGPQYTRRSLYIHEVNGLGSHSLENLSDYHTMALTWSRLLHVLNGSALFVSLALVGLSPAIIHLANHGMRLMDKAYPQGSYEWYRGPNWDMNTKHKVRLMYESTNEYMMFTAAAVSALAGLIGIVGFFTTLKVNTVFYWTQKRTLTRHRHLSPPPKTARSSSSSSQDQ